MRIDPSIRDAPLFTQFAKRYTSVVRSNITGRWAAQLQAPRAGSERFLLRRGLFNALRGHVSRCGLRCRHHRRVGLDQALQLIEASAT